MGRLEYALTNDDYVAFNRFAATSAPAIVAQSRRVRVTGTLVTAVLAVVVFWLVSGDLLTTALMTAVLAAVMWFIWPATHQRAINTQLRRLAKAGELGRLGHTVLTWDESGLTETAEASHARVGWERVRRVEESTRHLFLFTGDLEALIVPRSAGDGVADLACFARSRLSAG
ncbi:MAG: YcxB family protein [Propionicimonas sp.]